MCSQESILVDRQHRNGDCWRQNGIYRLVTRSTNAFVAFQSSRTPSPTLLPYFQSQPFSIMRFFISPYCVSSYSGVASSNPGHFISIVPTDVSILIPTILVCTCFPLSVRLMTDWLNYYVYPKESSKYLNERRRRSSVSNFAVARPSIVLPQQGNNDC